MTPASRALMQRMLARMATYPASYWDKWDDAISSGSSRAECKRLERLAYQAEAVARHECDRIRASFESGASWSAADEPAGGAS